MPKLRTDKVRYITRRQGLFVPRIGKGISKTILIATTCLLLSSCAESDQDRAFGLMQEACHVEKDSESGEFISYSAEGSDSLKAQETWDPQSIPMADLNKKYEYFNDSAKLATQAAYLDPAWSDSSDALTQITYFLDKVYQVRAAGEADYLEWSEQDFNLPKKEFETDCQTVVDLLN